MDIRMASEKDLEAIVDLCKECSRNMMENSIDQWDEIYPNQKIFLDDIKNNSLYLALSDNVADITGCIVFNEYQDPEYQEIPWQYTGDKIGVVHRLMVHPKYEGKGIAQSLVKHIEDLARNRNYQAIRLDTFTRNPRAVNFYHKLGYEVRGKVTFRKGEFFCCEKLM